MAPATSNNRLTLKTILLRIPIYLGIIVLFFAVMVGAVALAVNAEKIPFSSGSIMVTVSTPVVFWLGASKFKAFMHEIKFWKVIIALLAIHLLASAVLIHYVPHLNPGFFLWIDIFEAVLIAGILAGFLGRVPQRARHARRNEKSGDDEAGH